MLFLLSSIFRTYSQCYIELDESSNTCLPVVNFQLHAFDFPEGSELEWTWISDLSLPIQYNNINKSDISFSGVNVQSGFYELLLLVSDPNGNSCQATFSHEILEIPEIQLNLSDTYEICDNNFSLDVEVLNQNEFNDINIYIQNQIIENSLFSSSVPGLYDVYAIAEYGDNCVTNAISSSFQLIDGPNYENSFLNVYTNRSCLELNEVFPIFFEFNSPFEFDSIAINTNIILPTDQVSQNIVISPFSANEFGFETINIIVYIDNCSLEFTNEFSYSVSQQLNFSSNFQESQILCQNQIIHINNQTFNSENNNQYSWYLPGAEIINESSSEVSIFYNNSGNYQWSLINEGECSDTLTQFNQIEISQNPTPEIFFDTISFSHCSLPFSLSVSSIVNYDSYDSLSFNWELLSDQLDITSNDQIFSYQINQSGNYNLQLELTDNSNLCSNSSQINIDIDDFSDFQILIDSIGEKCQNYQIKLGDYLSGIEDNWILNSKFIGENSEYVFDLNEFFNFTNISGDLDLQIDIYSNISDCDTSILIEKFITIIEISPIIEQVDFSSCNLNLPVNINLNQNSIINGTNNISFDWNIYNQNELLFTTIGNSPSIEINQEGIFDIELIITDTVLNCQQSSYSSNAIIIDSIEAILISQDSTINVCSPYLFNPQDFDQTQTIGNYQYEWKIIGNEMIYFSDDNFSNFLIEEGGEYDLILNLTNEFGCQDSDTIFDFINVIKIDVNIDQITNICDFELPFSQNFSESSVITGSSGYDVFWSFYDNDDILFYSTNDLQPNLTFNQQGYYSANLLVTDSIFGCFNTEYESDILVLDSLVINIDSSDFFISNCNPYVVNYSSIFDIQELNSDYIYSWNIYNNGELYQNNISPYGSFYLTDVGIYNLEFDLSNQSGCSNNLEIDSFIILDQLDISLSTSNQNYCFNEGDTAITIKVLLDSLQSEFDVNYNVSSFDWEIIPQFGSNFSEVSSNINELIFSTINPDIFNVKITVNIDFFDHICQLEEEISVEVGVLPQILSDSVICVGQTFSLSENSLIGIGSNTSYYWESEFFDIENPTSSNTLFSAQNSGIFPVNLTVNNDNGCSESDELIVNVYEVKAEYVFDENNVKCAPAVFSAYSTNNDYIVSYDWSVISENYDGSQTNFSSTVYSENSFEFFISNYSNSQLNLNITSQHGCTDSYTSNDTIQVVSPLPKFSLNPNYNCAGVNLNIQDSSLFIDNFLISYGNGLTDSELYNIQSSNEIFYPNSVLGNQDSIYIDLSLTGQLLLNANTICYSTYTDSFLMYSDTVILTPEIDYVTVSDSSVNIFWNELIYDNYFDSLNLYHTFDTNFWNLESKLDSTSNNYIHSYIFTSSKVNSYFLTQEDSCGNLSDSSNFHSTILLETSTPNYNTILLEWSPYIGWDSITSYDIYRSIDGGNYEYYASQFNNSNVFKDSFLCNIPYTYYVEANHPNGIFKSRSNKSTTIPQYINFSNPIYLTTTVLENKYIRTSWPVTFIGSGFQYNIDRWDDYFGWIEDYSIVYGYNFDDYDVGISNRIYKYRVNYSDNCGNIGPDSFYGQNIVLKGIQTLSNYDLRWNQYEQWNGGVLKYIVEVLNQQSNIFENIIEINAPNNNIEMRYIDSDLNKNVDSSYCYRIKAISFFDENNTSYSNTLCFTPEVKEYFPTAFSPNSDGLNDNFSFNGNFAKELKISVYDRWGNEVYFSEDLNFEWDGNDINTGKKCIQGLYVIRYKIIGFNNFIINKEDHILLLR